MDYYFHSNFITLKLAGLYRPNRNKNFSTKLLTYSYNIFIFIEVCLLYPIFQVLALKEAAVELTSFLFALKLNLSQWSATIRFLLWHYNYRSFLNILDDLKKYMNPEQYEDEKFSDIYAKTNKYNKFRCVFYMSVATSLSGPKTLTGLKHLIFDDNQFGNNKTRVDLPFITFIPWDYEKSMFKFSLTLIFQWQSSIYHAWIISSFMLFYIAILENVTMHFDLIKRACGSFQKRILKFNNKEEGMRKELGKITSHIKTVIRICGDIENIYTYIMLFQVIFSITTMCSNIYTVSILPFGSAYFVGEVFFWFALIQELFTYAYYGTNLTYQGTELSTAFFHMEWYTFNKPTKSSLFINMIRMQKPIYMTIGKFQPIGLSTFLSILKMAYSIYAGLRTTQQK